MGKAAYDRYAASREVFKTSSEAVGVDIARVCFGDLVYLQQDSRIIQPAIVTVDLAEYAAYREMQGDADIATGLSLGMYAAMGAAGVFESYADAAAIAAKRALIMHEVSTAKPGQMAGVVGMALHELEPIVKNAGAKIAVIRDRVRSSFVVTGSQTNVDEVEKETQRSGKRRWEKLNIMGAFHFDDHEESKGPFSAELKNFTLGDPKLRLLGNHALYLASAEDAVSHVLDQLTETSDWDAVISRLNEDGVNNVVEFGPDPNRGLARQMVRHYKANHIQFPIAS